MSALQFSGRFLSPRVFSAYIHRSQNLVDFLPLSMPFCAFGAKRHGTGNKSDYNLFIYAFKILATHAQTEQRKFMRVYNLMINLLMGNFLIINASIIRLSNKKENNYKLYVVVCNGQNACTL